MFKNKIKMLIKVAHKHERQNIKNQTISKVYKVLKA